LEQEADATIARTRQLIKENIKQKYIEGRDSVDVGHHWDAWKDEG
jgi:hypothetical protein